MGWRVRYLVLGLGVLISGVEGEVFGSSAGSSLRDPKTITIQTIYVVVVLSKLSLK